MTAAGVSLLTLSAALSLLFLGETRVPSGLAALLIASRTSSCRAPILAYTAFVWLLQNDRRQLLPVLTNLHCWPSSAPQPPSTTRTSMTSSSPKSTSQANG